jgi:hypothetical protein
MLTCPDESSSKFQFNVCPNATSACLGGLDSKFNFECSFGWEHLGVEMDQTIGLVFLSCPDGVRTTYL